ncbi:thiamine-phosphate kinase [Thermodesulforhabdus norvegica]|uniref:Thiamine-monophosphate kinase n=1 Tax=Thermodesulforhabdus norvegica TaxID=39841 RepID=A0A1I4TPR2_9BACT|nr:thiamine-phosphate kinase [Thermodesulforhabdus norvegica]SFM78665.1 thiamine-phosphate kinase [Thermodesulforhabdus norvegica]
MQGLTIKDLGEFGFIELIRNRFRHHRRSDVVVGIGDDVAVVDVGPFYLLATCDGQVEGVHFLSDRVPPRYSGRRLVAVNASDIAAMGGTPLWALVAMNVPDHTDVSYLEEFYEGIVEGLEKIGASLVGGNCSRTSRDTVFDLFLTGRVEKGRMVTRSGAKPGDLLVVSGTLGRARAGLTLLLRKDAESLQKILEGSSRSGIDDLLKNAILHYYAPEPRMELGRFIGSEGLARAMIDVSDGLLQDTLHICRSSGVDVVIDLESIPVDESCALVAKEVGEDPLEWALTGGEDYELLFATTQKDFKRLFEIFGSVVGLNVIGYFREGSGRVWIRMNDGSEVSAEFFASMGWTHF